LYQDVLEEVDQHLLNIQLMDHHKHEQMPFEMLVVDELLDYLL
jgi:hypothetical protein